MIPLIVYSPIVTQHSLTNYSANKIIAFRNIYIDLPDVLALPSNLLSSHINTNTTDRSTSKLNLRPIIWTHRASP
jgi:hypothetical protein